MAKVTIFNEEYICFRAVKGIDYIYLYDIDGICQVAFNGISDFANYSVSGGDWSLPD